MYEKTPGINRDCFNLEHLLGEIILMRRRPTNKSETERIVW
jgi:hypothetical protein